MHTGRGPGVCVGGPGLIASVRGTGGFAQLTAGPHTVWGPPWRSHARLGLETPVVCRQLHWQDAGLSGSYPEPPPKGSAPSETTRQPSGTASGPLAWTLGDAAILQTPPGGRGGPAGAAAGAAGHPGTRRPSLQALP